MHERLTFRGTPYAPALDEAARLLDPAAGTPTDDVVLEPESVPILLALLALGAVRRVRTAMDPDAEPWLRALILGRYVAWTGDLHFAAPAWARLRPDLDRIDADTVGRPEEVVLRAASLQAIANLATDLGDPQAAARIHAPARTARANVLELLADGTPALRDLAAAAGFGADVPAHDGTVPALPADVPGAAAVVLHCAHGVLGLDPDATRHRLRLRPVVPVAGSLGVTGIGFGDALVELDVENRNGAVVMRLDQVAGALPITALLEPVVTGVVVAARVDGQTADLAVRPAGAGCIVPVQLALDAPRRLELDLES